MEISQQVLDRLCTEKDFIKCLREETHQTVRDIDYVEDPITYAEFFRKYLLPNRACILGPWATAAWRSRLEWAANNDINFDQLKQEFGRWK